MSLREQLEADMKTALRGKDALRLATIRSVRGAVKNREIEIGESLDDEGIQRVIRRLAKQRSESISQYRQAGRQDLADQESREKEILDAYLPAVPDASAVEQAVVAVIEEVGASGPKDMGRVMKPVLERLGPAADGKLVSHTVKRILAERSEG